MTYTLGKKGGNRNSLRKISDYKKGFKAAILNMVNKLRENTINVREAMMTLIRKRINKEINIIKKASDGNVGVENTVENNIS